MLFSCKHMSSFCKIFLLIILLIFFQTYCQEKQSFTNKNTTIKIYTKKDGLLVDFIKTICTDDYGFLWVAGENYNVRNIINSNKRISIQRFDGNNFHEFELPDFEEKIYDIENLQKLENGNLLIRANVNSGQILLTFNPYTTAFNRIKIKGDFVVDALSNLFYFNNKKYIFIQKGNQIHLCILTDKLQFESQFSFSIDTNKKYLLENSTHAIFKRDFIILSDDNFQTILLDWKGNTLKSYNGNNIKRSFEEKNITYFFKYDDLNLYKLDEEKQEFFQEQNFNDEGNLVDLITDKNNNVLTITSKDNFASIHELKNNTLVNFFGKYPFKFTDNFKAYSDNISKGVWIGTNNNQLIFIKKNNTTQQYLNENSIRSILNIKDQKYLVATENKGWFTIDNFKKKAVPFPIFHNKKKFVPYSTRKFIKDGNYVWSNDHDNILKVNLTTGNTEKWNHYPVICMEQANDSLLVVGTKEYYLLSFNQRTKEFKKLIKTDSLYIYDLAVNKNSNLVVCGTNKGLLTYNLKNNKTKFFTSKHGLIDEFILMVDTYEKKQLLLGTKTGKVVAFNPTNETFTTLFSDEKNAGIATIIPKKNSLWINTFNGLINYDLQTKETTRFSTNDGLTHNEANRYSALKTKNGMFFGSLKGLYFLDSTFIHKTNKYDNIELLKIQKFNKKTNGLLNNYDRSSFSKTITLPAEQKSLNLGFALSNSINNSDVNFRYRLNKNEWIDLNNTQSLSFTNLASGTYSLEIEALNFSGNSIASPLLLTINSQEFFYKTWWFYLIVFLLFSFILIWQLHQSKQKQKLQQQFSQDLIQSTEEERTRIAKELHDSVNQQLTLIKKQTQKLELDAISGMVNKTLEEVRSISRNLYPNILKQLGLTESIEQLLLDVDEQTELFITADIVNIDPYFNDKQALNLYRIIQEIIANVLKHAEAKSFLLEIIKVKNQIKIVAEDNGNGFDINESKKNHSLGLKTLQERVQILNGELTIESELKKGTTTIITIFIK